MSLYCCNFWLWNTVYTFGNIKQNQGSLFKIILDNHSVCANSNLKMNSSLLFSREVRISHFHLCLFKFQVSLIWKYLELKAYIPFKCWNNDNLPLLYVINVPSFSFYWSCNFPNTALASWYSIQKKTCAKLWINNHWNIDSQMMYIFQSYALEKPCSGCSSSLTKVHTTHWEGGRGCRNKITMSR